MNYYCAVFDKTIKTKSNIKQLQSLTHDEIRKLYGKTTLLLLLIFLT